MESLLTLIKIDLTYHDDMVHSQWLFLENGYVLVLGQTVQVFLWQSSVSHSILFGAFPLAPTVETQ